MTKARHSFLQRDDTKGFTLIELSIVLVIIGLIVGGVLVGRDLIEAAQVRKTVSQKESFDAAVNTFRLKYNCPPGDCANATQFGLDGGFSNGDGDGVIGGFEHQQFWTHLYYAGLILVIDPSQPDQPGLGTPSLYVKHTASDEWPGGWAITNASPLDWNSGTPTTYSPTDITGSNYVVVSFWGDGMANTVIFPTTAFQIDSKIDDGLPLSGIIRGGPSQSGGDPVSIVEDPTNGAAGSGVCINNGVTPARYDIASNGFYCSLLIKSGF